MGKMTVYHGSHMAVKQPQIIKGKNTKDNDLFFTCSLIEYISRKTKNKRADIVNALGKETISKIYELADIYHSDNINRVSEKIDDFNSSFYYDAPQNILNTFLDEKIE